METRYQPGQEQLDLIERFLNAYNAIEHNLRDLLGKKDHVSFSYLVQIYADRYPRWREKRFLRMVGELRNVTVHQREHRYEYLSVPLLSVVEEIERIRDQFLSPELVFPEFKKNVVCFEQNDLLSDVLQSVVEHDYSQFPILENGEFCGLLTENGITRWLAMYRVNTETIIDFSDIQVNHIISKEEYRRNSEFIPRNRAYA